ncbi:hypothetical protein PAPYR_720 [Paratrimastix pyriformis]|uniref:Uncharacterized protein n=1 Tax=Paratrimastix pyriformis TaxID=342808 RepID=A0ABQ8UW91_9EUKA|nr:hypothetical protein PAPYR_720 [Paratrimastix pyriformis]
MQIISIKCPICALPSDLPTHLRGIGSTAPTPSAAPEPEPPIMCGLECGRPATLDCITCGGSLCEECFQQSHARGWFRQHKKAPLGAARTQRASLCSEHDRELDHFCTRCRRLVCPTCCAPGGSHQGHAWVRLADRDAPERAQWEALRQELMSIMEVQRNALRESRRAIEGDIEAIRKTHERFEEEAESAVAHLTRLLEERRQVLVRTSRAMATEKVERLTLQHRAAGQVLTYYEGLIRRLQEAAQKGDPFFEAAALEETHTSLLYFAPSRMRMEPFESPRVRASADVGALPQALTSLGAIYRDVPPDRPEALVVAHEDTEALELALAPPPCAGPPIAEIILEGCPLRPEASEEAWVRVSQGGTQAQWRCSHLAGAPLLAGQRYRFRACARNEVGRGAWSAPLDITKAARVVHAHSDLSRPAASSRCAVRPPCAALPGAPEAPRVQRQTARSVTVQWQPPPADGGAPLLGFRLLMAPLGPVDPAASTAAPTPPPPQSPPQSPSQSPPQSPSQSLSVAGLPATATCDQPSTTPSSDHDGDPQRDGATSAALTGGDAEAEADGTDVGWVEVGRGAALRWHWALRADPECTREDEAPDEGGPLLEAAPHQLAGGCRYAFRVAAYNALGEGPLSPPMVLFQHRPSLPMPLPLPMPMPMPLPLPLPLRRRPCLAAPARPDPAVLSLPPAARALCDPFAAGPGCAVGGRARAAVTEPPAGLAVVCEDADGVTLRWQAPAPPPQDPADPATAQAPVLGYQVQCTVRGLAPGRNYFFRLRALTALGPGGWSSLAPVKKRGPPASPPRPVLLSEEALTLRVAWGAPGATHGLPVAAYRLAVSPYEPPFSAHLGVSLPDPGRPAGADEWLLYEGPEFAFCFDEPRVLAALRGVAPIPRDQDAPCADPAAPLGMQPPPAGHMRCGYWFRVCAWGPLGLGPWSEPLFVQKKAPPLGPTRLRLESETIIDVGLAWEAPPEHSGAADGVFHAPMTGYLLQLAWLPPSAGSQPPEEDAYREIYRGPACRYAHRLPASLPEGLSAEREKDLLPGAWCGVRLWARVAAWSAVGRSDWGPAVAFTKKGLPGPPAAPVLVEDRAGSVVLRWGPPGHRGHGAIGGYRLFLLSELDLADPAAPLCPPAHAPHKERGEGARALAWQRVYEGPGSLTQAAVGRPREECEGQLSLVGGRWYRAAVAAVGDVGEGLCSPVLRFQKAAKPPPPPAPRILSQTAECVRIVWSPPADHPPTAEGTAPPCPCPPLLGYVVQLAQISGAAMAAAATTPSPRLGPAAAPPSPSPPAPPARASSPSPPPAGAPPSSPSASAATPPPGSPPSPPAAAPAPPPASTPRRYVRPHPIRPPSPMAMPGLAGAGAGALVSGAAIPLGDELPPIPADAPAPPALSQEDDRCPAPPAGPAMYPEAEATSVVVALPPGGLGQPLWHDVLRCGAAVGIGGWEARALRMGGLYACRLAAWNALGLGAPSEPLLFRKTGPEWTAAEPPTRSHPAHLPSLLGAAPVVFGCCGPAGLPAAPPKPMLVEELPSHLHLRWAAPPHDGCLPLRAYHVQLSESLLAVPPAAPPPPRLGGTPRPGAGAWALGGGGLPGSPRPDSPRVGGPPPDTPSSASSGAPGALEGLWREIYRGPASSLEAVVPLTAPERLCRVRLCAENGLGLGPWGEALAIRKKGLPGAPTGLRMVSHAPGALQVAWEAPPEHGGVILAYHLQVAPLGPLPGDPPAVPEPVLLPPRGPKVPAHLVPQEPWRTVYTGSLPAAELGDPQGLPSMGRCAVRVRALNGVGAGPWSDQWAILRLGVPGQPASLLVLAEGPTQCIFQWRPSSSPAGGRPVRFLLQTAVLVAPPPPPPPPRPPSPGGTTPRLPPICLPPSSSPDRASSPPPAAPAGGGPATGRLPRVAGTVYEGPEQLWQVDGMLPGAQYGVRLCGVNPVGRGEWAALTMLKHDPDIAAGIARQQQRRRQRQRQPALEPPGLLPRAQLAGQQREREGPRGGRQGRADRLLCCQRRGAVALDLPPAPGARGPRMRSSSSGLRPAGRPRDPNHRLLVEVATVPVALRHFAPILRSERSSRAPHGPTATSLDVPSGTQSNLLVGPAEAPAAGWEELFRTQSPSCQVDRARMPLHRHYYFRVTALTPIGAGPPSNVVHVPTWNELFYREDGEAEGLFSWLGTDMGRAPYRNPALGPEPLVAATCSSTEVGAAATLVGRDPAAYYYSENQAAQWVRIELLGGRRVAPTHYTLRTRAGCERNHLRSWKLEGSADGQTWVTLRAHLNDDALSNLHSQATWAVEWRPVPGDTQSFRFIRLSMTGHDSSGYDYLMLGGIELYGLLVS